MKKPSIALKLAVSLLTLVSLAAAADADNGFDHSDWQTVLDRFVDERGFVDYEGLAGDRAAFDRYIRSIQRTSPTSNPELFPTRDHELAFWINAYNAQVFLGVLDWGTDIDSVWAGLISGRNFFVKRKITLGGQKTSLKAFEDDIIRAEYQDPRIHAAINCASISCPRLTREAYLGETLDQQLADAMEEFVNANAHVKLDRIEQEVQVSKIFDWFERDFLDFQKSAGAPRTLIAYINRFRAGDEQIPSDYDVEFLRYDKGLNRQ